MTCHHCGRDPREVPDSVVIAAALRNLTEQVSRIGDLLAGALSEDRGCTTCFVGGEEHAPWCDR